MNNETLFLEQSQLQESTPSNGKLLYRYWKGDSSHVFIYLHGVQSHSGWLVDSGERFQKRGFTVYAPDRRGSGQSGFVSGDIDSYKTYLQDLRAFLAFVRKREPNKKIHLIGLCWGARLCLPVCAEDNEEKIDSLILLSPGLYPKVDYSFMKKLQIAFAYLFDAKKKFHLPLKDSFFTQNQHYLSFIQKDSLGLRQVTARFLIETLRLNQLARKSFKKVKQPIYLLLAENDKIVDVEKTVAVFNKRANVEFKTYKKWEHTLEFESNADLFYEDVIRWIEQKDWNR